MYWYKNMDDLTRTKNSNTKHKFMEHNVLAITSTCIVGKLHEAIYQV
jgi:hypothetical protein